MTEIKTLNSISPSGLDRFDKKRYAVSSECDNPTGILVRSADMKDAEFGSKLIAIARAGAGVNNIPVERCSDNGIVVFNTPGANANGVKEIVIAAILMASRNIVPAVEWVKTLKGEGDAIAAIVEKGKKNFVGPEVSGKKLGIIGLGAIGVQVANTAVHLNMEVFGYDPYISVDAAWGLSRSVKHAQTIKDIYSECDYITIHVPQNSETAGMINSSSINMMKNGVRLFNFARGGLVVEEDVKDAVMSGKIACYVTDFPSESLIGVNGIITVPHLGASTPESEDNCAEMAARELIDYIENGNIKNSVNYPDIQLERVGTRICVIHDNIPNVISGISSAAGEAGINIENLVNKSKKQNACTVLEIIGELAEGVTEKIAAIEGVRRVRVIK